MSLGYYSLWPCALLILALAGFIALPIFKSIGPPDGDSSKRVSSIDGLRGFLALGVVLQHGAMSIQYLTTGYIGLPRSTFYAMAGQAGVAVFFMITGYLFWSQMIKSHGRPDWIRLYVARVFRILPLYWVLLIISLSTMMATTHFRLYEPSITVLREFVRVVLGGLFQVDSLNGDTQAAEFMGVSWTLRFEWLFYGSLLLTSFAARNPRAGWAAPLAGLAVIAGLTLHHSAEATPPRSICILLFLIGMTAAGLRAANVLSRLNRNLLSAGIVLCLLTLALTAHDATTTLPLLLIGLAFFLVVSGGTMFGVLSSMPARRLGDVSYGIYLLQEPVKAALFRFLPLAHVIQKSPLSYWIFVTTDVVSLTCVACLAHVLIERPGIAFGKKVIATIDRARSSRRNSTEKVVATPAV